MVVKGVLGILDFEDGVRAVRLGTRGGLGWFDDKGVWRARGY